MNYSAKLSIPEDALDKQRLLSRRGSHIYFYDEIDPETMMIFQGMYEDARIELSQRHADQILETGQLPEVVTVHINSPGGDAACGIGLYDFLQAQSIPCIGIVEGMAASAATLLLCGCCHRAITKHSTVLVHELRSMQAGKYSQLKDFAANNDFFMDQIKDIYEERTTIPKNEIDDILSHDIFWSAEDAKEYGIIDQIIGEELDEDDEEIIITSDKKSKKSSGKDTKKPARKAGKESKKGTSKGKAKEKTIKKR